MTEKIILEQKLYMEKMFPEKHLQVCLGRTPYMEMCTKIQITTGEDKSVKLFGMPIVWCFGDEDKITVECIYEDI